MGEQQLVSTAFRTEREKAWRRLEALVAKVESDGIRALSAVELGLLPRLYSSTLSALSVARSISLDRNLLEYLETLAGRAYFCVYGAKRTLRVVVAEFFLRDFPRTFRLCFWHFALAALFLALGTAVGWVLTATDDDRFYAFVSEDMAQGRDPTASTETLREALYSKGDEAGELTIFASFLFSHNTQVGLLSFGLGFLIGLPVFYLMFSNGLILGAIAALYAQRGLGVELWAWLLPHGVTELGAIAVCGGAGLIIAQALLFPGRYSRVQNLAIHGRRAGVLVIGAVAMFLAAGLIEGLFRQLVHDVAIRYGVVLLSALFWILYLGFAGREVRR